MHRRPQETTTPTPQHQSSQRFNYHCTWHDLSSMARNLTRLALSCCASPVPAPPPCCCGASSLDSHGSVTHSWCVHGWLGSMRNGTTLAPTRYSRRIWQARQHTHEVTQHEPSHKGIAQQVQRGRHNRAVSQKHTRHVMKMKRKRHKQQQQGHQPTAPIAPPPAPDIAPHQSRQRQPRIYGRATRRSARAHSAPLRYPA